MTNTPPPYDPNAQYDPNANYGQYGQYQPQQPYQQQQFAGASPTPPQGGTNGMGIASLIIGIVALLMSWIPWIGFAGVAIGFVGIIFGVLGLALDKYRGRRTIAIIGTIVSGIALILSTFLPFLTGIWWTVNWLDDSGIIDEFETRIEQDYETYVYEDDETDDSTVPELTFPEETLGSTTP